MERVVWPRAILHLDMDAFFVNVHILENPEHKAIPLAVGGKPGQRGVIASASYEARAKGCLLYTSPSPRDATLSRMPSSA